MANQRTDKAIPEPLCTCLLPVAWIERCPKHGFIPGTAAARDADRPSDATFEEPVSGSCEDLSCVHPLRVSAEATPPLEPALRGPFTCPKCNATHNRGPLNGHDVYRCLRCGETTKVDETTPGYYHPDPEVEAEVRADVEAGQRVDRLVERIRHLEAENTALRRERAMPCPACNGSGEVRNG